MSRSHSSRTFKKATGHSPQEWLLKLKLEKALSLIVCEHHSMTHISIESGNIPLRPDRLVHRRF
ncbi:helix-turn-helix domain-containing protein [Pseudomonas syringae]|uniref:helix-turn-helix domain-containing protein n=1 Tax=Pseudomonas syringae TaxID=317 RepID=UPI0039B07649